MPSFRQRLAASLKVLMGDSDLLQVLFPTRHTQPPRRSTREYLKAYSEMPWLRAAVDRVSTAVATPRWRVFSVKRRMDGKYIRHPILQHAPRQERQEMMRRMRDAQQRGGGSDLVGPSVELVELDNHPLLALFYAPNPVHVGVQHRRLTQSHLDLTGEAHWVLERNGLGMPMSAYAIPPDWVQDLPTPKRPTYLVQVDGVTYGIPATEVVSFMVLDPLQPFGRGTAPAQSLGDELETDEYAARHTRQWFFNSARPDLVVTLEGASDPELRRAETAWAHRHQGFWRAFKPFFSNRKLDVKDVAHTFREQQLIELRRHERDTIIQVYGIPPELLGIVENSNRATIDAASLLMGMYVVEPRLELLRDVLQQRLVPQFDPRLILDYDSPVADDKVQQLDAAKAFPHTLRVDEWRRRQGEAPLGPEAGGDLFLSSLAVQATERPGEASSEPAGGADDDEGAGDEEAEGAGVLAPPAPRGLLGPGVVQRAEDPFLASVQRLSERLSPSWRRTFVDVATRLRGQVDLGAVEAALASGNPEAVARLLGDLGAAMTEEQRLARLLRTALTASMAAASSTLASTLGIHISFGVLNPRALDWIRDHGAELARNLTAGQRAAVQALLQYSFTEAVAPRDLARMLRNVVGLTERQAAAVASFRDRLASAGITGDVLERRVAGYAEAQLRRRATTIARTETIGAANQGQQLLWEDGIAQGLLDPSQWEKDWLITLDDRLDAKVCEPMPYLPANQHVPITGTFTTGQGEQVMTPPAHPDCRCAVRLRKVQR